MKVAFEGAAALGKGRFASLLPDISEKLEFVGAKMDLKKIVSAAGELSGKYRNAAAQGLASAYVSAQDPDNELMFMVRWFLAGCGASWALFWAH